MSSFPRPCCPHLLGRQPIMVDRQWVCDFFFFLLGQSQGGCIKGEPKLWSPSPSQGPSQLPGCWLRGPEGAAKPFRLKNQLVTSKLNKFNAGVTKRISREPCGLCHLHRVTFPLLSVPSPIRTWLISFVLCTTVGGKGHFGICDFLSLFLSHRTSSKEQALTSDSQKQKQAKSHISMNSLHKLMISNSSSPID